MASTTDADTKKIDERSRGAVKLHRDDIIYEEEIRYCWIDEDGLRVSPVHRDFGKALSWISDWPAWKDRIDDRELELSLKEHHSDSYRNSERERIQAAKDKLTLTGKPPTTLRRLVIRTTVETIIEHESLVVEHTIRAVGLAT